MIQLAPEPTHGFCSPQAAAVCISVPFAYVWKCMCDCRKVWVCFSRGFYSLDSEKATGSGNARKTPGMEEKKLLDWMVSPYPVWEELENLFGWLMSEGSLAIKVLVEICSWRKNCSVLCERERGKKMKVSFGVWDQYIAAICEKAFVEQQKNLNRSFSTWKDR